VLSGENYLHIPTSFVDEARLPSPIEIMSTLSPFPNHASAVSPADAFVDESKTGRQLQAEFYHENGYLVVENALSADEVDELRRDTVRLCRNEAGVIHGAVPAPASDSDDEVLQRYLCIHFPHKLSDLMLKTLAHPSVVDVLTNVVSPNVKAMQSMLFIKAAGKPGQAWHQDEDFIPTRDRSLIGAWIAMDDATVDNGCLWIIPGSHKPGILWPMEWHGDRRFDCTHESTNFPYGRESGIPVEVPAGSVVYFNGYTLHRSLPNLRPDGYRRALVNHYCSAETLLPWHRPKERQTMALADYRDIVMVAGVDPYAYKGIENTAPAHVRGAGEGGCKTWDGEIAPYND
jgi:ectoine hydroxylase-related dioxygenase (phytanoyl-CoA dioxygenase family)